MWERVSRAWSSDTDSANAESETKTTESALQDAAAAPPAPSSFEF